MLASWGAAKARVLSRRTISFFCLVRRNKSSWLLGKHGGAEMNERDGPAERAPQRRAELRVATLFASVAAASVLVVALTGSSGGGGGGGVALLGAPVRPRLGAACGGCLASILKANAPWAAAPSFDPRDAMLCVSSTCRDATLTALPAQATEQLSALPAGAAARGPSPQSKVLAALNREQHRLDVQQLELNWKRARVFAAFMGPPGASNQMVLADWVPPLDPHGRPVPSWLRFVPAGAGATTRLFGTDGAGDSEAPRVVLSNHSASYCMAHGSCAACTRGGCAWCGGAGICSASCPRLPSVAVYAAGLKACPGPSTLQEEEQAEDAKQLHDLVVDAAHGETGAALVRDNAADETTSIRAETVFSNSTRDQLLNEAGDPAVGKEVAKAKAAGGSRISLAAALAPLNTEQAHLNAKRQMLFFRTETGVVPGAAQEVYDPTVGGGGTFDNWAKPTTTWSLIGRPAPGWLHWGMDNDGGYFNPAGGTQWDPQMLDPAGNRGTDGPATNEYRAHHPHPEDEPMASF